LNAREVLTSKSGGDVLANIVGHVGEGHASGNGAGAEKQFAVGSAVSSNGNIDKVWVLINHGRGVYVLLGD